MIYKTGCIQIIAKFSFLLYLPCKIYESISRRCETVGT